MNERYLVLVNGRLYVARCLAEGFTFRDSNLVLPFALIDEPRQITIDGVHYDYCLIGLIPPELLEQVRLACL